MYWLANLLGNVIQHVPRWLDDKPCWLNFSYVFHVDTQSSTWTIWRSKLSKIDATRLKVTA